MDFEYYLITFLFVAVFILSGIVQIKVNSTYEKYSQVRIGSGLTGEEIANQILRDNGVDNVNVVKINGKLTDNYNNRRKTISLSSAVYDGTSVAAVAIAAHEASHAVQYRKGFVPIYLRGMLIPVSNFLTKIGWPIVILLLILDVVFFAGTICNAYYIVYGIILLLPIAIQLCTLPVELNASKRAIRYIRQNNICEGEDLVGAKKMLTSAALTYVANFLIVLLEVFKIFMYVSRRRR